MLPIYCALDTTDLGRASQMARMLAPHIAGIKLGLEFFTYHGPQGVTAIAQHNIPIFLDLKFHDIPNTVAGALRSALSLNVQMITVHTSGGKDMLTRAADTVSNWCEQYQRVPPQLLGVTILTSMDALNLRQIGMNEVVEEQVLRLATLAKECGLDGVVCSPHEIGLLRMALGNELLLVVPGIRPEGSETGDQKRVLTPAQALALGANYLVIGRPITEATDPIHILKTIEKTLAC
ncbi:MAG: orotidine-5'-phosphate decarboxylase [Alphaproteobacteria bacterium]|nr:orotidine-5'-phosphate decarboxylase [Alphaproteobacteria bacterium]